MSKFRPDNPLDRHSLIFTVVEVEAPADDATYAKAVAIRAAADHISVAICAYEALRVNTSRPLMLMDGRRIIRKSWAPKR